MEKILNVYTNPRNRVSRTLAVDVDGKEIDVTLTLTQGKDEVKGGQLNLSRYEAIALANHLISELLPNKAIITRKKK